MIARVLRAAGKSLRPLTLLLAFAVPTLAQHTYYISSSSGSDSNSASQAQLKGTPWAHLPGMTSCAANCRSYTPVAGDTFIQMGCDVWTNSDLPVQWNWSGSAAKPITITVDKSWYNTSNCPAGWNRPVWNGQNAVLPTLTQHVFFRAAAGNTTAYGVLDNIEMTGLACTSSCGPSPVYESYVDCYNTCNYWTVSNNYIHGWSVQNDGEGNCFLISVPSGAPSLGGIVIGNVIDGSDSVGQIPAGATCNASGFVLSNWTNNVIHDLANGIVGHAATPTSSVTISGNLLYNVRESNGGSHPNFIETLAGGTYYISNNVIHDMIAPGGEALFLGNPGETDYVWNNVMYNLQNSPGWPQIFNAVGTAVYAYNNTIVPGAGGSCFNQNGATATPTVVLINNNCITTGTTASGISGSPVFTTNVLMTPSQAAAANYSSPSYAYLQTNLACASQGTCAPPGTNLSSVASGQLASLSFDTTYGCTQQTKNGVVQAVCPARMANARPNGAAWDAGAYQYSTAPTNLRANSQ